MKSLRIGIVQAAFGLDIKANTATVSWLIRDAAAQNAHVILAPELFESTYFPQHIDDDSFNLARSATNHPTLQHMQALAKELNVVLPISFYERDDNATATASPKPAGYYNSMAMIDADGAVLGVYRKTHIPSGPGYEEKYYFAPGDTGFKVWDTRHGRIGVGICWDQWFPESARAMALQGADVILYPTAIGSEPPEPDLDSRDPWRRVMVGHAVANATPIAAANRIGREDEITFYGSSFIADQRGELVADLPRDKEGVAVAEIDLDELQRYRQNWGFFGDRKPEHYAPITSDKS